MKRIWEPFAFSGLIALALAAPLTAAPAVAANQLDQGDLTSVIREAQTKVVKLFGAGGLQGLESYQSGMLISPQGHVLTAWSYVLDTDETTVVLDDGRRFEAKLLGADPLTEIAVLKFDAGEEPLAYFDLSAAATADVGTRVLALSNLFGIATGDEPVSALHGSVSAIAPLDARRGAFATHYRGDVLVVDAATNNPGASGGALVDQQGRLLGMLGKELRSELTGTWLNYVLPVEAFGPTVEAILAGRFSPPELNEADRPEKPLTLVALGIVLVPEVVSRTPPYIDRIVPESLAAEAGLRPDDLVVMIDSQVAASCRELVELLGRYEQDEPVRLAVLRDEELLQFELPPEKADPATVEAPGTDPSATDSTSAELPAVPPVDIEPEGAEPAPIEPSATESSPSED